eukprot:716747-Prorocentrum_minimum.AAC.1
MFSPSVRLSTVALFRLRKHSWSESNSRSPAAEWLSKSLTVRVDPNSLLQAELDTSAAPAAAVSD